jgi:hypothetical protein
MSEDFSPVGYLQGSMNAGDGGLPGQPVAPDKRGQELALAPEIGDQRNVAKNYLSRVLDIRQAFRRNLRQQVVPAPAIAPDFRTKARADADRAFDEMTRLASEEAERVQEEHNRALELALEEVDKQGAELSVLMQPPKVPIYLNPFFLLAMVLANNMAIFGVGLMIASMVYGLGLGGAGLIVLESLQVQTPSYPVSEQAPLEAVIASEAGSCDVSLRPKYGHDATLSLAMAKQPGLGGTPTGAYSLLYRAEPSLTLQENDFPRMVIFQGEDPRRDYATTIRMNTEIALLGEHAAFEHEGNDWRIGYLETGLTLAPATGADIRMYAGGAVTTTGMTTGSIGLSVGLGADRLLHLRFEGNKAVIGHESSATAIKGTTTLSGAVSVAEGGMQLPQTGSHVWCRHDATKSSDWFISGGTLSISGSAGLSDNYRDSVQARGEVHVRDGDMKQTALFDSAQGSLHTEGRIIGTDAALLGSSILGGPLRDQEVLTIEGHLHVKNNGLLLMNGDVEFGSNVTVKGKLSIRSDQWHETFSISTRNNGYRADTVLQHVEPGDPENVVGFGSDLTVLSKVFIQNSTRLGSEGQPVHFEITGNTTWVSDDAPLPRGQWENTTSAGGPGPGGARNVSGAAAGLDSLAVEESTTLIDVFGRGLAVQNSLRVQGWDHYHHPWEANNSFFSAGDFSHLHPHVEHRHTKSGRRLSTSLLDRRSQLLRSLRQEESGSWESGDDSGSWNADDVYLEADMFILDGHGDVQAARSEVNGNAEMGGSVSHTGIADVYGNTNTTQQVTIGEWFAQTNAAIALLTAAQNLTVGSLHSHGGDIGGDTTLRGTVLVDGGGVAHTTRVVGLGDWPHRVHDTLVPNLLVDGPGHRFRSPGSLRVGKQATSLDVGVASERVHGQSTVYHRMRNGIGVSSWEEGPHPECVDVLDSVHLVQSPGVSHRVGACAQLLVTGQLTCADTEAVETCAVTCGLCGLRGTGNWSRSISWRMDGTRGEEPHCTINRAEEFTWTDIKTKGMQINSTEWVGNSSDQIKWAPDDGWFDVDISSIGGFIWYGQQENIVSVGTNGLITFGTVQHAYGATGRTPCEGAAIIACDGVNVDGLLAVFWTDLSPTAASDAGVYYYIDSVSSLFVAQWDRVMYWAVPERPDVRNTFQATLFPDGRVVFSYEEMDREHVSWSSESIGMENQFGTRGIQISYGEIPLPRTSYSIPVACHTDAGDSVHEGLSGLAVGGDMIVHGDTLLDSLLVGQGFFLPSSGRRRMDHDEEPPPPPAKGVMNLTADHAQAMATARAALTVATDRIVHLLDLRVYGSGSSIVTADAQAVVAERNVTFGNPNSSVSIEGFAMVGTTNLPKMLWSPDASPLWAPAASPLFSSDGSLLWAPHSSVATSGRLDVLGNSTNASILRNDTGIGHLYANSETTFVNNLTASTTVDVLHNTTVDSVTIHSSLYVDNNTALANVTVRGQVHIAKTVEVFAGQPLVSGVRTFSGDVDMAVSSAADFQVMGHMNVTNKSHSVAVAVYNLDGFKLNVMKEMLNNSGVTVEERLITDSGFPHGLPAASIQELYNGSGVQIESATLRQGGTSLVVNSIHGQDTALILINEDAPLVSEGLTTNIAFFQTYHHRQSLARVGRPQLPAISDTELIRLTFNSGLDSFNKSEGNLLFHGRDFSGVVGFNLTISDDMSSDPIFGTAAGVHISSLGCGNIQAGTSDLVVGALNEFVLPYWNDHRSGMVITFNTGVDYVQFDDTDDDLSPKVLYAYGQTGTLIGQTEPQAQQTFVVTTAMTCGVRIWSVEFDTANGTAGGVTVDTCFTLDNLIVRGELDSIDEVSWYTGCHDPEPWPECELHHQAHQPANFSSYDYYDSENGEGECVKYLTMPMLDGFGLAFTCADHFCPQCLYGRNNNPNGFCDATCGFCFTPEPVLHAPVFAGSVSSGTEVPWDNSLASRDAALTVGLAQAGQRTERLRLASDGNMSTWNGKVRVAAEDGTTNLDGNCHVYGTNLSANVQIQGCTQCSPLQSSLHQLHAECQEHANETACVGYITYGACDGAAWAGTQTECEETAGTCAGASPDIPDGTCDGVAWAGTQTACEESVGTCAGASPDFPDGTCDGVAWAGTRMECEESVGTCAGASPDVPGATTKSLCDDAATTPGTFTSTATYVVTPTTKALCDAAATPGTFTSIATYALTPTTKVLCDGATTPGTFTTSAAYLETSHCEWLASSDRTSTGPDNSLCLITFQAVADGLSISLADANTLVNNDEPCRDCRGIVNGQHIMDPCGECWKPNDKKFASSCTDCSGTLYGNFTRDACSVCLPPDDDSRGTSCEDCQGDSNGDFRIDACGICSHRNDPLHNESCMDCSGEPLGGATIDSCGECQHPDSPLFNLSCTDCSGSVLGDSTLDECGACYAPDDPLRNSTCTDCNNQVLGGFTLDACNSCLHEDDPARNTSCIGCDGVVASGKEFVTCVGMPGDKICGLCTQHMQVTFNDVDEPDYCVGVEVVSTDHPLVDKSDDGRYFFFNMTEWTAAFGSSSIDTVQPAVQCRGGVVIWKGDVHTWDNAGGAHGRREHHAEDQQWNIGDVVATVPNRTYAPGSDWNAPAVIYGHLVNITEDDCLGGRSLNFTNSSGQNFIGTCDGSAWAYTQTECEETAGACAGASPDIPDGTCDGAAWAGTQTECEESVGTCAGASPDIPDGTCDGVAWAGTQTTCGESVGTCAGADPDGPYGTCDGVAWVGTQAACEESAGTCAGASPDVAGATTKLLCDGAAVTPGTFTSTATYVVTPTTTKALCDAAAVTPGTFSSTATYALTPTTKTLCDAAAVTPGTFSSTATYVLTPTTKALCDAAATPGTFSSIATFGSNGTVEASAEFSSATFPQGVLSWTTHQIVINLQVNNDSEDTIRSCLMAFSSLNVTKVTPDCLGNVTPARVINTCNRCLEPDAENFESICHEEDCSGTRGSWIHPGYPGSWTLDPCGTCLPPADPMRNMACQDCANVSNGVFRTDACSLCLHAADPLFNSSCKDCAGAPAGNSMMDRCGKCLDRSLAAFDSTCLDCVGNFDATELFNFVATNSSLDSCGICYADEDRVEPIPLIGQPTTSSQHLANSPANAFDSDETTFWNGCCIAANMQWIGYTHVNPHKVVGYTLQTGYPEPLLALYGEYPTAWNFQARNANSEPWVTIDEQVNQTVLVNLTQFTFPNTIRYRQFRWEVIAVADIPNTCDGAAWDGTETECDESAGTCAGASPDIPDGTCDAVLWSGTQTECEETAGTCAGENPEIAEGTCNGAAWTGSQPECAESVGTCAGASPDIPDGTCDAAAWAGTRAACEESVGTCAGASPDIVGATTKLLCDGAATPGTFTSTATYVLTPTTKTLCDGAATPGTFTSTATYVTYGTCDGSAWTSSQAECDESVGTCAGASPDIPDGTCDAAAWAGTQTTCEDSVGTCAGASPDILDGTCDAAAWAGTRAACEESAGTCAGASPDIAGATTKLLCDGAATPGTFTSSATYVLTPTTKTLCDAAATPGTFSSTATYVLTPTTKALCDGAATPGTFTSSAAYILTPTTKALCDAAVTPGTFSSIATYVLTPTTKVLCDGAAITPGTFTSTATYVASPGSGNDVVFREAQLMRENMTNSSRDTACLDCRGKHSASAHPGADIDACGVCGRQDEPEYNASCKDCLGDPNGGAMLDACEVCRPVDHPTWSIAKTATLGIESQQGPSGAVLEMITRSSLTQRGTASENYWAMTARAEFTPSIFFPTAVDPVMNFGNGRYQLVGLADTDVPGSNARLAITGNMVAGSDIDTRMTIASNKTSPVLHLHCGVHAAVDCAFTVQGGENQNASFAFAGNNKSTGGSFTFSEAGVYNQLHLTGREALYMLVTPIENAYNMTNTCDGAAWAGTQAECDDSAGTCAGASPDIPGATTKLLCDGAATPGTFTSTATYASTGVYNEGKMQWTGDSYFQGGEVTVISSDISYLNVNSNGSDNDASVSISGFDLQDSILELKEGPKGGIIEYPYPFYMYSEYLEEHNITLANITKMQNFTLYEAACLTEPIHASCGIADSPSSYSATTDSDKAFDNDVSTYWDGCCSGYPNQELKYTLAEERPILSYSITTTDNECPVEWTFEASEFGAAWVVLDTQINDATCVNKVTCDGAAWAGTETECDESVGTCAGADPNIPDGTCDGAAWAGTQTACEESAGTCAGASPDVPGTTTKADCDAAAVTPGTFTSSATYVLTPTTKADCDGAATTPGTFSSTATYVITAGSCTTVFDAAVADAGTCPDADCTFTAQKTTACQQTLTVYPVNNPDRTKYRYYRFMFTQGIDAGNGNGYKVADIKLFDDYENANGCGVRLPDDDTCETGKSCAAINILNSTAPDGDYVIDPDGIENGVDPFLVFCDMEIGSAWTLIYSYPREYEVVETDQVLTAPTTVATSVTTTVTTGVPFTDFPDEPEQKPGILRLSASQVDKLKNVSSQWRGTCNRHADPSRDFVRAKFEFFDVRLYARGIIYRSCRHVPIL